MPILLEASSARRMRCKLGFLDISVPERTAGRTTRHAERYCIAHLLSTISARRLNFPLTVEHGDRPDFVLKMPGGSIGIEHTEAVSENEARAQALRERGLGPDTYFVQPYSPGEPRKSAAQLRVEIEADEPGDGWVGDSPEREWAAAILHHIDIKTASAKKPGYAQHSESWLIVYSNLPFPGVKTYKAVPILESLLRSSSAFAVFNSIFVLTDSNLIEFRISPIVCPVVDPRHPHWLVRLRRAIQF